MDLIEALHIVSSEHSVPGRSDAALCRQVAAKMPDGVRVHDVPVLHGGSDVRPLEALLRLAVATRPKYHEDILDAYAHWALLRYLGAFSSLTGKLALSAGGEGVRLNQRRVMSEDLGIGLALVLAATWITAGDPQPSRVLVADVDLLSDGLSRFGIGGPGPRPDYVLTAAASEPGMVRIGLLECKGTRTQARLGPRLAAGCQQIADPVRTTGVPGLVVSGLFTGSTVQYSALDVGRDPGPLLVPADHPLVREAQAASWAGLSMFAGNDAAQDRWARSRVGDPQRTNRRAPRDRVRRVTGLGAEIDGVVNRMALPGGTAEVVFGLDRAVDIALVEGTEEGILQQQNSAAQRRRGQRPRLGESRGLDGSVLTVTPLDA